MKSFLNIVAEDIHKRYGNDLSKTIVVFPNKRASLFLNEELVNCTESDVMWSPRYVTISELFTKFAGNGLQIADHIKLIIELYDVYSRIVGTEEPLDEFYSWGELLLNDFDDIDKNMADAKLLFENTANLHEYDSADYLTEEQKDALKRFFRNFNDNQSSILKENFVKLWNKLGDIYCSYREQLLSKGIAYEGLLYRHVIEENDKQTPFKNADRYIFVGFNMVHKVEQKLFDFLKDNCDVRFYWDYDEYYMETANYGKTSITHEAGRYIREYLKHYPNDITDQRVFQNFRKGKDISFINATTEDIQARYVSQWLTPERIAAGKKTAIILCNEALLPTVVNCLPPAVKHINITTGYPIANTPSATLVQQFFTLHLSGRASNANGNRLRLAQVKKMLCHPYIKYICPTYKDILHRLVDNHVFFPSLQDLSDDENIQNIFRPIGVAGETQKEINIAIADRIMWMLKTIAGNCNDGNPLTKETLFRMYTLISRIHSLAENDGLDVDTITFQRLIIQAIRSTSVPFHGEPVSGIQIMGVLETRNLDFEHILVLSCNEGNMPKGMNDSSFIPHSIRMAYGLTTIENKVCIYAYYFHRLLQRASDIQISYNTSNEGGQMQEGSRFLLQLIAESNLHIKQLNFNPSLIPLATERHPLAKTDDVMEKLNSFTEISPSAINSYLRCQLSFFYKHVCGIKDNNDDEDTEVDNKVFGNIFHCAAEYIYKPFVGNTITESMYEAILKDEHLIQEAIDYAFKVKLFKMPENEASSRRLPSLDGSQLLKSRIIRRLLVQLLKYDKEFAPIKIKGLELEVKSNISFEVDGKEKNLGLRGYIDRLDVINTLGTNHPIMRIIDYKTGNHDKPMLNSIEDIFDPQKQEKHSDYYLQTFLYSIIQGEENAKSKTDSGLTVSPCLLYPSKMHTKDDSPILQINKKNVTDASVYAEEYKGRLRTVLASIFSKDTPFEPQEDMDKCKNCFYKDICFSMQNK